MLRPIAVFLLACAVALVGAVPAQAEEPPLLRGHAQKSSAAGPLVKRGKARTAAARDRLWATVNICDTAKSPDAMGVRASMPGNGTGQRMFMRFSAQWWSGSRQQWLAVPNGTSPWLYAGSARYVSRQRGYTFDFATPEPGRGYVLRGIVEFEWRAPEPAAGVRPFKIDRYQAQPARRRSAAWSVARRNALLTRSGIKGVDGGDPPGTSKAMCMVANLG
jgi:hypothetical protein